MFSLGKHTNKYAPCMVMCIGYVKRDAFRCSDVDTQNCPEVETKDASAGKANPP